MPTISSLRSKPLLTPVTMFATSDRVRPWMARAVRLSSPRLMRTSLFSMLAVMPGGIGCMSFPLGPSARTTPSSIRTFTPSGMVMGFLPIRDMTGSLPHVGENFSAHLLLARVTVADDAARGRHDGDAHPGQDRGHLVVGHVDAPAGLGHAHEAPDQLLVGRSVLEVHAQRPLLRIVEHAVVLDEALVLQDLGDPHLQLGAGDVHLFVFSATAVPDPGEEISDGIALHGLPARLHDAGALALEGDLPEAETAQLELAQVPPRTPAQLAARVGTRAELRGAL